MMFGLPVVNLEVKGGVQAVYGAKAVLYKSEIDDLLGIDS